VRAGSAVSCGPTCTAGLPLEEWYPELPATSLLLPPVEQDAAPYVLLALDGELPTLQTQPDQHRAWYQLVRYLEATVAPVRLLLTENSLDVGGLLLTALERGRVPQPPRRSLLAPRHPSPALRRCRSPASHRSYRSGPHPGPGLRRIHASAPGTRGGRPRGTSESGGATTGALGRPRARVARLPLPSPHPGAGAGRSAACGEPVAAHTARTAAAAGPRGYPGADPHRRTRPGRSSPLPGAPGAGRRRREPAHGGHRLPRRPGEPGDGLPRGGGIGPRFWPSRDPSTSAAP
jgi:hypothetical protein